MGRLSYRMNRPDDTPADILVRSGSRWVVEGDREETGIAVCATTEALADYARHWGMGAEKGARLIEVVGGRFLKRDEPPAFWLEDPQEAVTIAVTPDTMGSDELAEWLESEPWGEYEGPEERAERDVKREENPSDDPDLAGIDLDAFDRELAEILGPVPVAAASCRQREFWLDEWDRWESGEKETPGSPSGTSGGRYEGRMRDARQRIARSLLEHQAGCVACQAQVTPAQLEEWRRWAASPKGEPEPVPGDDEIQRAEAAARRLIEASTPPQIPEPETASGSGLHRPVADVGPAQMSAGAVLGLPRIDSGDTSEMVKERLPAIQEKWNEAVGQGTPWPEPEKLQTTAMHVREVLGPRSVAIAIGQHRFVCEDGETWQKLSIWVVNGVADSEYGNDLKFSAADLVTLARALGAGARLMFQHQFPGAKVSTGVCYDTTGGKAEPERVELKALPGALKALGWEVTSDKNTYVGPKGGTFRVQVRARVAKVQVRDEDTGEWREAGDVKLPALPSYYALLAESYPQWHAPVLDHEQNLQLINEAFKTSGGGSNSQALLASIGFVAGRTGQEQALRPKSFLMPRWNQARQGYDRDPEDGWNLAVQRGQEARQASAQEKEVAVAVGLEGGLTTPQDAPAGTIVIWHSAEAGTIIVGTERADAPAIKTLRSFKWSGRLKFWYVPSTRGLAKPNLDLLSLKRQLEAAGVTKPILVHEERVTKAEAAVIKAELRAESEANAPETLDANAERLERKGLPLVDSGIGRQRPTARRTEIAKNMRERGEPLMAIAAVLRKLAELWREDPSGGRVPRGFRDVRTAGHLRSRGVAGVTSARNNFWDAALKQKAPSESPEALREKAARTREQRLVGTQIPGFFPTPEGIAAELVERTLALVELQPGDVILEPSAGEGALAREAEAQAPEGVRIVCIERAHTLCEILREQEFEVLCGDFSEFSEDLITIGSGFMWGPDKALVSPVKAVVMNPPFEKGADAEHVQRAWGLLAPGGALGALVSEGLFFRQDAKAVAFREWLAAVGAEDEKLPEQAFMQSRIRTTGVASRMVIARKVGGAPLKEVEPEPEPRPEPPTVEVAPEPEPAPPAPTREWRYGAYNRPPGYATAPSGMLRVDPAIKPRDYDMGQFLHGFAVYNHPLTAAECYSYELTLIGGPAEFEALAQRIAAAERTDDTAKYFLEMWDDPRLRKSAIQNVGSQWEDFNRDRTEVPVWVPGGVERVAKRVEEILRGRMPGRPAEPEPEPAPKRVTAHDLLQEVVRYGGLLVRRGDVELDLNRLGVTGPARSTYMRLPAMGAEPEYRFESGQGLVSIETGKGADEPAPPTEKWTMSYGSTPVGAVEVPAPDPRDRARDLLAERGITRPTPAGDWDSLLDEIGQAHPKDARAAEEMWIELRRKRVKDAAVVSAEPSRDPLRLRVLRAIAKDGITRARLELVGEAEAGVAGAQKKDEHPEAKPAAVTAAGNAQKMGLWDGRPSFVEQRTFNLRADGRPGQDVLIRVPTFDADTTTSAGRHSDKAHATRIASIITRQNAEYPVQFQGRDNSIYVGPYPGTQWRVYSYPVVHVWLPVDPKEIGRSDVRTFTDALTAQGWIDVSDFKPTQKHWQKALAAGHTYEQWEPAFPSDDYGTVNALSEAYDRYGRNSPGQWGPTSTEQEQAGAWYRAPGVFALTKDGGVKFVVPAGWRKAGVKLSAEEKALAAVFASLKPHGVTHNTDSNRAKWAKLPADFDPDSTTLRWYTREDAPKLDKNDELIVAWGMNKAEAAQALLSGLWRSAEGAGHVTERDLRQAGNWLEQADPKTVYRLKDAAGWSLNGKYTPQDKGLLADWWDDGFFPGGRYTSYGNGQWPREATVSGQRSAEVLGWQGADFWKAAGLSQLTAKADYAPATDLEQAKAAEPLAVTLVALLGLEPADLEHASLSDWRPRALRAHPKVRARRLEWITGKEEHTGAEEWQTPEGVGRTVTVWRESEESWQAHADELEVSSRKVPRQYWVEGHDDEAGADFVLAGEYTHPIEMNGGEETLTIFQGGLKGLIHREGLDPSYYAAALAAVGCTPFGTSRRMEDGEREPVLLVHAPFVSDPEQGETMQARYFRENPRLQGLNNDPVFVAAQKLGRTAWDFKPEPWVEAVVKSQEAEDNREKDEAKARETAAAERIQEANRIAASAVGGDPFPFADAVPEGSPSWLQKLRVHYQDLTFVDVGPERWWLLERMSGARLPLARTLEGKSVGGGKGLADYTPFIDVAKALQNSHLAPVPEAWADVAKVASKDEARPSLEVVRWRGGTLTATDGRRLRQRTAPDCPRTGGLFLPARLAKLKDAHYAYIGNKDLVLLASPEGAALLDVEVAGFPKDETITGLIPHPSDATQRVMLDKNVMKALVTAIRAGLKTTPDESDNACVVVVAPGPVRVGLYRSAASDADTLTPVPGVVAYAEEGRQQIKVKPMWLNARLVLDAINTAPNGCTGALSTFDNKAVIRWATPKHDSGGLDLIMAMSQGK